MLPFCTYMHTEFHVNMSTKDFPTSALSVNVILKLNFALTNFLILRSLVKWALTPNTKHGN